MKLQDQKSLPLTAKQRLAVSRQALVLASKETLLGSMARLAKNALLHFLESRGAAGLKSTEVDAETTPKSSDQKN